MSDWYQAEYSLLPGRFHQKSKPRPVRAPSVLQFNESLAEDLGFKPQDLTTPRMTAAFAGNANLCDWPSVATVYGGHQFGGWSPQLGDGRAHLLADAKNREGALYEVQLKGSGPTPFSRGGDGRAGIGPILREYIVSEAMHALGIPTTRSLVAMATGQPIYRERQRAGAVLTRVAKSHVRIGTFQYFSSLGDLQSVRTLADFMVTRCYPEALGSETPYLTLFRSMAENQVKLVVGWMRVGFIHGVMNTDNCTISGETLDYGPCAFLDHYQHDKVFSSIDHYGRYAFGRQIKILIWNLIRFAETLVPLVNNDSTVAIELLTQCINEVHSDALRQYQIMLCQKIGLNDAQHSHVSLADELLHMMGDSQADYTLTFRLLSDASALPFGSGASPQFADQKRFEQWRERWVQQLNQVSSIDEAAALMKRVNPSIIPRNHLVEKALTNAEKGDLSTFQDLTKALADPYQDHNEDEPFTAIPKPHEVVKKTFCGT